MRAGIVVFPGSNCDHDCYHVLKHVLGARTEFVWHKTDRLPDLDLVVVPGGFSYGDYLRAGALARFSPIMQAVEKFAADGGLVLGICNGFQILVEAGLLPGALMRNRTLKFTCKPVFLRVENTNLPYTGLYRKKQVISMPIAHAEGNYYIDPVHLERMKKEDRIVFRYCSPQGESDPAWNPNGSVDDIAGLCNPGGNVLGMMPHPERFSEPALGGADGLSLFKSILNFIEEREAVRGKR